jgi:hypothetical protein
MYGMTHNSNCHIGCFRYTWSSRVSLPGCSLTISNQIPSLWIILRDAIGRSYKQLKNDKISKTYSTLAHSQMSKNSQQKQHGISVVTTISPLQSNCWTWSAAITSRKNKKLVVYIETRISRMNVWDWISHHGGLWKLLCWQHGRQVTCHSCLISSTPSLSSTNDSGFE